MIAYKKVGGLHFIKAGRLGLSFYVSRRKPGAMLEKAKTTKNNAMAESELTVAPSAFASPKWALRRD